MGLIIMKIKVVNIVLAFIAVSFADEFTEEEQAALEVLREAGLLDVDVEELLEKSYDTEYYDYKEDTTGLIDYDTKDLPPDNASDRGGPRRRRRPGNQRKRQVLGPRPNALQVLASRLFFGAGSRGSRPAANYGPPKKKPSYGRPKPAYGPPKKKKRPTYHKPTPSYEEPKPSYHEPEKEDEYGSPQAPV